MDIGRWHRLVCKSPSGESFRSMRLLALTRYMLQSHKLLLRKYLSEADAEKTMKKCQGETECPGEADLSSFIALLNQALKYIRMDIVTVEFEGDGKRYYGLVNSDGDQISEKFGSCFRVEHVRHFQRMIKCLLDSSFECNDGDIQGKAGSMELCSKGLRGDGLSSAEAASNIEALVKAGWLAKVKDSDGEKICLGPRSALELGDKITQMVETPENEEEEDVPAYDDEAMKCGLCGHLVTTGCACTSGACGVRMHTHCAKKLFINLGRLECPKCKEKLDETNKCVREFNAEKTKGKKRQGGAEATPTSKKNRKSATA